MTVNVSSFLLFDVCAHSRDHILTSETRCMVSGPSQASSVPRIERPTWLKRSTGASFFCWPGGTKSAWDWDDAEWSRTRATRTIRMTLNTCLPHGELLPGPAMAGSARKEAQGEQGAKTGTDSGIPAMTCPNTLLDPILLAEKGRSEPFNFSWAQPSDSRVPLSHSLPPAY